jgi:hypothetical protein
MSHDQQVLQGSMMPSSEIDESLRNKGMGLSTGQRPESQSRDLSARAKESAYSLH